MDATLKLARWALGSAFLCAGVALAQAPAPGGAAGVTVRYADPQGFSESRNASYGSRSDADYLAGLRQHIEYRASGLLRPGEQLAITITDIDRAGAYEPWRGPNLYNVRIVKDIYPPRIDLRFEWTGARGEPLKSGERKLRDPAFLMTAGAGYANDPLRYEKLLLDDWMRRELARPAP